MDACGNRDERLVAKDVLCEVARVGPFRTDACPRPGIAPPPERALLGDREAGGRHAELEEYSCRALALEGGEEVSAYAGISVSRRVV